MEILRSDNGSTVSLEGSVVTKTVHSGEKYLGKKYSNNELVKREADSFKKLENIKGIQELLSSSENILKTTYIDAPSIRDFSCLPYEYFRKLKRIIKDCEKKGVFRVGINQDDFLIDSEGNPHIVDFGNVVFSSESSYLKILCVTLWSRIRLWDIKRRKKN